MAKCESLSSRVEKSLGITKISKLSVYPPSGPLLPPPVPSFHPPPQSCPLLPLNPWEWRWKAIHGDTIQKVYWNIVENLRDMYFETFFVRFFVQSNRNQFKVILPSICPTLSLISPHCVLNPVIETTDSSVDGRSAGSPAVRVTPGRQTDHLRESKGWKGCTMGRMSMKLTRWAQGHLLLRTVAHRASWPGKMPTSDPRGPLEAHKPHH